jgi:hypothetical protein
MNNQRFISSQVDKLYVNNFNLQFEIPASSPNGLLIPIIINKEIYPYDSLIKLKQANITCNFNTNTLRGIDLEIPFLTNINNTNGRLTIPLPYNAFVRDQSISGGIGFLCPETKINKNFNIRVYRCNADGAGAITAAAQTIWVNLEFEIYSDHQY